MSSLFLPLLGCAGPGVAPVPVEHGRREVVAERGEIRAVLTLDAWQGEPRDLDQALVVLHLSVENRSARPVHLGVDRVTLLDPSQRQWRPLSPAEARVLAVSGRTESRPIFSFGLSGGSGGFGVGIGAGIPFGGRGEWGSPDILSRAFAGDEILPGGRSEGFLYFPRWAPESSRFTLLLSPVGGEELSIEWDSPPDNRRRG